MTTPEDPNQPPAEGTPPPQPDYSAPPPPPAYGAPPPPPAYGAPPPAYGTPPPGEYGQQYSGAPYGGAALAPWGSRVGSALIDYFGLGILAAVFFVAHILVLAYLIDVAAFVWGIYNAYLGGSTGQSYGKKILGTRLVREGDGSLIGGGAGIGRVFVHILDGIPCYLGYLWPLWDSKKQTFADKIMGTIVIKV
jgi:uncharacterized RDD family membrane protein YckC